MPRFLVEVNYTPEGIQGVLAKGGTARRDMIEKMLADGIPQSITEELRLPGGAGRLEIVYTALSLRVPAGWREASSAN